MSLVDYRGLCHCGAFKFKFRGPEIVQVFSCTCSYCARIGYLWARPGPVADTFEVTKGSEETTLVEYQFGLAHKFCPVCGTSVLARQIEGKQAVGINTRCIVGIDFETLPVVATDKGAHLEPAYTTPASLEISPSNQGTTVYHGSCHCGAVKYTIASSEVISEAKECNCSICSRDGVLFTFPEESHITWSGLAALTEYTYGTKKTFHGFCKHCGVPICERFLWEPFTTRRAINVRTINNPGFDFRALRITKNDGRNNPPAWIEPE
ncbi:GFA domain-containing protein [Mycena kentingensis (nom. inval.)]|nr:GFA domain-containing protein [Mycena kentingensis (nom. inval.)]